MIRVEYIRIPKATVYNAIVDCTKVEAEDEEKIRETVLWGESHQAVSMEDLIQIIHKKLASHPDARITMGPRTKDTKLTQLGDDLRDMIRDNLPEALVAFAPIHRTVRIRDKEIAS
jgi:hypothetical protein